jgi:hypothetical protein
MRVEVKIAKTDGNEDDADDGNQRDDDDGGSEVDGRHEKMMLGKGFFYTL